MIVESTPFLETLKFSSFDGAIYFLRLSHEPIRIFAQQALEYLGVIFSLVSA